MCIYLHSSLPCTDIPGTGTDEVTKSFVGLSPFKEGLATKTLPCTGSSGAGTHEMTRSFQGLSPFKKCLATKFGTFSEVHVDNVGMGSAVFEMMKWYYSSCRGGTTITCCRDV